MGVHDPAAPPDASDAAGRHSAANWIREHFASRWEALRRGCHCRRRAIVRAVRWCCCGAGGAGGSGTARARTLGRQPMQLEPVAAPWTPVTLRGSCERASVGQWSASACCPLRVPGLRGMRSRGIAAAVGP
ncbi:hypothetical protein TcYC6_0108800 [Trypanosoma cruzi]|nr:hypothetical protein TcYC6_0108800 [Trypanosoma cruzi]